MHLLIPFAAPLAGCGPELTKTLSLPNLAALLDGEPARDDGEGTSLTPPHERALANALGLAGADGCLPWAARAARSDGHDTGESAWGLLTPVHWQVGIDRVGLTDPAELALDQADSQALFDAVRDLFESEGIVVVFGAPTRWYLAHDSLRELGTASLDRVIGHDMDPWLPRGPEARLFRRLQNEVQMRLHDHPVNEARESRGQLPVNSVWLSGCGVQQAERPAPDLQVDDRLRVAALSGDGAAWQSGWEALDAGPLAELRAVVEAGRPGWLTLCGERSSACWTLRRRSVWQRLKSRWSATDPVATLESL